MILNSRRAIFALLTLFAATSINARLAVAQTSPSPTAHLVKDIAPSTQLNPAQIREIHPLMSGRAIITYEVGRDTDPTTELWVYDQNTQTSVLLAIPGGKVRNTMPAIAVRDRFFFALGRDSGNPGLWAYDASTLEPQLVSNVNGRKIDTDGFVLVNDIMYFRATGNTGPGQQLWRSDGTSTGTYMVATVPSSTLSNNWGVGVNSTLFFISSDTTRGTELWKSDGTAAGTRAIASLGSDENTIVQHLVAGDNRAFAVVSTINCVTAQCNGSTTNIWASSTDGNGAILVRSIVDPTGQDFAYFDRAISFGDAAFLTRVSPSGTELWKVDGASGAMNIIGADFRDPIVFKDSLFAFSSSDWSGTTLEQMDAITGTFSPIVDVSVGVTEAIVVSDNLVFSGADGSLWISDGSAAGTRRIDDVTATERTRKSMLTNANGHVLFALSYSGSTHETLWTSDGTPDGTTQASADGPSGSAFPMHLTAIDDKVYFNAIGPNGGAPLWLSDGTENGTMPMDDTTRLSATILQVPLAVIGDRYFFTSGTQTSASTLWTQRVGAPIAEQIRSEVIVFPDRSIHTVLNNALYFIGSSSEGSTDFVASLWRTDGTATGATSLWSCEPNRFCDPAILYQTRDLLYFQSRDENLSYTLWRTDGTRDGTLAVLSGLSSRIDPRTMTALGTTLLFVLDDAQYRDQLWRSDGTPETTRMVSAFDVATNFTRVAALVNVEDHAYIKVVDLKGTRIWRTDGTPEGTVASNIAMDVRIDLNPIAANLNGKFVFSGGFASLSGQNQSLHIADPSSGTSAVLGYFRQIREEAILVSANAVYFVADDGTHGMELWRTAGTPESTVMIRDIAPGALSSAPDQLIRVGETIFFTANDGTTGRELWALPVDAASGIGSAPGDPNGPSETSGENGGGGGALSLFTLLLLALWPVNFVVKCQRALLRRRAPHPYNHHCAIVPIKTSATWSTELNEFPVERVQCYCHPGNGLSRDAFHCCATSSRA